MTPNALVHTKFRATCTRLALVAFLAAVTVVMRAQTAALEGRVSDPVRGGFLVGKVAGSGTTLSNFAVLSVTTPPARFINLNLSVLSAVTSPSLPLITS